MSKQESKELSTILKGGVIVAVVLGVALAAAPKHEALQPIQIAQATAPSPHAGDGTGPTGYFPDRFLSSAAEDLPQPEAF